MADLNARVPMSKIAKDVTMEITITGMNGWLWRLRVGVWLIKCASFVSGIPIVINEDPS